jgi:hypothetical protein
VLEELAVVALQLVQLVELLHSQRGLLLTQLLEEVVVVTAITTVVFATMV